MFESYLDPFGSYVADEFHIGGSVSAVLGTAKKWRLFGEHAEQAGSDLRRVNNGGFEGSEGDRYRELVNEDFPSHLDITSVAHLGVSRAISEYGQGLSSAKSKMSALIAEARIPHANVQALVTKVKTLRAQANADRAGVWLLVSRRWPRRGLPVGR